MAKASATPQLGVCYYPEHWPETRWAHDAKAMHTMGIRVVRIGEFAWSRLEATPGQLTFDWLQRAMDTLHNAGLSLVLGTPTATPPRWMLDKYPDLLAVDERGQTRGFGSRRHYCFSHRPYRDECRRIVTELATAFGQHPGLVGWQTDNEYGCHDTIPSYSAAALQGFQQWCAQQYATIDALNQAWGNVFWSMEYNDFDQIGFPVAAVTETNPAHRLAFWRYSSDQVVAFNQVQTEVLRKHCPQHDLIHNYMGNFVQFDHHAVAKDLDVASWDNYPLGFLTRDGFSEATQAKYLRTGHPDSSAFHHDLYRGCNQGRWWLMEQQPGPVNWAPYNPAPLDGMVRFWGWEAIAHGAEVVSYFRWRQCPFAQEQMHTGLCRPDGSMDVGGTEVTQLGQELQTLLAAPNAEDVLRQPQAPVALVFDYTGLEAQRIQQPNGRTFDPLRYAQQVYGACRALGVDVDILPKEADLTNYAVVLVTTNTLDDAVFCTQLEACSGHVVLMPRVGSKTQNNAIPANLPPGQLQSLIPIKVVRSESLPHFIELPVHSNGADLTALHWRDTVESSLEPAGHFADGTGFHYRNGSVHYVNACLSESSLATWLSHLFTEIDIHWVQLPEGVRVRATAGGVWVFNFNSDTVELPASVMEGLGISPASKPLLGALPLQPAAVALWTRST